MHNQAGKAYDHMYSSHFYNPNLKNTVYYEIKTL